MVETGPASRLSLRTCSQILSHFSRRLSVAVPAILVYLWHTQSPPAMARNFKRDIDSLSLSLARILETLGPQKVRQSSPFASRGWQRNDITKLSRALIEAVETA
jgi:hypothetical protein